MRFRHTTVYVSLWCMLMAAATARGAVAEGVLGFLGSLVLWGSFYTIGLAFGYSNAQKENPGLQQVTNGVAGMGVALFLLMMFTQGLVAALLTFVLCIQGAQNFTLSRPRELYYALAISFVVILFAASESKNAVFIFCIALYALSGVCTLAALHFEQRSHDAHAVALSGGQFRLPAGMGLLTGVILAFALVLYFVLPQPPATHVGGFFAGGGPFYHRSDWQDETGKGFDKKQQRGNRPGADKQDTATQGRDEEDSDSPNADDQDNRGSADTLQTYRGFTSQLSVDNSGHGKGLDPNAIILYVRADRPLYLRGRTFDTFEDNRWSESRPETEKLDVERHDVELHPHEGDGTATHTVEVAAPVGDIIFAASEADELDFPGSVIARDRNGALFAPQVLQKGTTYSVEYHETFAEGHPLGDQAALSDDAPYLQLPDDLSPRIVALAKQAAAGRTGMQAAVAIENYLRDNYRYTLATANRQNYTPLDTFLFETHRGHCEYFASAMAVMLRTLGIPSRVVSGVSAQDRNPVTGYYEVRVIDGHAWVEANIAGAGWVTFEPTPFYALPGQQPRALTPAAGLADYVGELTRIAQQVDPQALRTRALETTHSLFQTLKLAARAFLAALRAWVLRYGIWLLLLLAMIASGVFLYHRGGGRLRFWLLRLTGSYRIRRARRAGPRALVFACYLQLERLLTAREHPRADGATVEEYAESLASGVLAPQQVSWLLLTQAFRHARYGADEIDAAVAREAYEAYLALERGVLKP